MHRYSERLMDHFMNPRRVGMLPHATTSAEVKYPTCGDVIRIDLQIEDDHITQAAFLGAGCGPGIACASYLLECVVGAGVDEAAAVTVDDICAALDLPAAKRHAAELAIEALRAAVAGAAIPSKS